MRRKMRGRLRKAGERMQPGFGDSIRQPLGTSRTADFRDSDSDGIDDRDQRRAGGININEKRRNRQARRQTNSTPTPPPNYDYGPGGPLIQEVGNGGYFFEDRPPVARPQPYPMPGGNDVKDIRGTNDPRNRKKRGDNSKFDFYLSDYMQNFNNGGERPTLIR